MGRIFSRTEEDAQAKRTQELRAKFPFIVKWDRMMGSYESYTDRQVHRAEETGAPTNATYEKFDSNGGTGKWSTTDDVTSEDTRRVLGLK